MPLPDTSGMAKVKVPLYRTNPVRSALIDTDATPGAVVGQNLYNADGSLYVPPDSTPAAPSSGIALDDVQANAAPPLTVEGSVAGGAFEYGWDGTTSDVPEPAASPVNLYFTPARVLATVLAGLSTATNAVITAADSVLSALGKLQAQVSARLVAADNLSDLDDATTARTNLGLGDLATMDAGNVTEPVVLQKTLRLGNYTVAELNALTGLAEGTEAFATDGQKVGEAPVGQTALVGNGTLDASGTFTRASAVATYYDATPTMQYAAANVPRWDHDPLTGAALGLLIEQQSTNECNYSTVFAAASAYAPRVTITQNAATAPDGTTTAALVVPNAGATGVQYGYGPRSDNYDGDGTTVWVLSGYLGKGQLNAGQIKSDENTGNIANFNYSAGTLLSTGGGATGRITSTTNYWRAYCAGAAGNTTGRYGFFDFGAATNRDGTQGINLWGVQVEVGSVATSYIPTNGAAATRSADILTYPAPAAQGTIILNHDAASGASLINTNSTDVLTSQGAGKIAIAWDASGTSVCYAGGTVTTGAAITWGADYRLLKNANAHIKPNGALLYTSKLSDSQLQIATTTGLGAGTGVPVYYSAAKWRVYRDDSEVAA